MYAYRIFFPIMSTYLKKMKDICISIDLFINTQYLKSINSLTIILCHIQ